MISDFPLLHQSGSAGDPLVLFGMGSPNVIKVLLMLEECGCPYALYRCDVILGRHRTADFLDLSPNGKVPVLLDPVGPGGKGFAQAESGAILIYLADQHRQFLPKDGAARYATLQWLMFQMSAVGPCFGQVIHFAAGGQREGYASKRFLKEAERLLRVIEARLQGSPFLAGEHYSIADMAVIPWLDTLQISLGCCVDGLNAITAWRALAETRPATRRALAIGKQLAELDCASFSAATTNQLDFYFGRRTEVLPAGSPRCVLDGS